jgi:hypothetical protein
MNHVLCLHDIARPLIIIATIRWTTNPYPPYSPNLAPSNFILSGFLQGSLELCHFVDDTELKHSMCKEI